MGRRLWLMMGIVLLASPALPVARGQTEGRESTVPEAALPGPPDSHLAMPGDFPPVEDLPDSGTKPKPKADFEETRTRTGEEIGFGGEGQAADRRSEGRRAKSGWAAASDGAGSSAPGRSKPVRVPARGAGDIARRAGRTGRDGSCARRHGGRSDRWGGKAGDPCGAGARLRRQ